jgi:hypothetical protein
MDGTFWKLCVKCVPTCSWHVRGIDFPCRLVGGDLVPGEPSPHAAEISKVNWKQLVTMSFNYRTAGACLIVHSICYVYSGM